MHRKGVIILNQVENPMVLANGYGIRDPQESTEFWGTDACGDEIRKGDPIVELDGEMVLVENIEKYIFDVLRIEKKVAGEEGGGQLD